MLVAEEQKKYYLGEGHHYLVLSIDYCTIGDWENSEKYINKIIELGNFGLDEIIRNYQRTADLAEKSGATDAAQRMRKRLEGLGVFQ